MNGKNILQSTILGVGLGSSGGISYDLVDVVSRNPGLALLTQLAVLGGAILASPKILNIVMPGRQLSPASFLSGVAALSLLNYPIANMISNSNNNHSAPPVNEAAASGRIALVGTLGEGPAPIRVQRQPG